MSEGSVPLLAVEGLDKWFGATHALRAASLSVDAGEALGLVGHNGAGKSTLIKIIAGAQRADAGEIRLAGARVSFSSPADAQAAGIRVIHQDAPLVPHFDTVDNCYLGRPHPRRFGFVDKRVMRKAVRAIAADVAPELPLDVPVGLLSASNRQLVRLVRALLDQGRILILDEPTAALSAEEATGFFAALARVRARGTAIILVTHRLDEIAAFCSRALLMVDGAITDTFAGDELSADALVAAMGGGAPEIAPSHAVADAAPLLSLEKLSVAGLSGPASLDVRPGEIVALYGLVGSGRSELLNAIWGWTRTADGTMTLEGKPYAPRRPGDAVARGVSYVAADRHRTGLFASLPLLFNSTLPLLGKFRWRESLPLPSRRQETKAFEAAAGAVELTYADAGQPARTLSGGNQQKLIFSRWAHRRSRVFLLDEPTEGVDIVAKAALRGIVRDIAADGNAVLVSTSDRDEALTLGDRIVVFRAGRVVADIARADASAAALSAAAQTEDTLAA